MNGHDEEEDTGPSVDSTDPEERIAARRIRIAKRVEMARREAMGEDPNKLKKEDKEEQSKSKRQIEDSRQRLTKLESDGTELVSNVRVAADAREAHRRTEEEEIQRQRTEKLEAEAKAGLERFDEITKKWEQANNRDLPMELHDLLKQQKSLSEAMIDEKNKLINDFQMELKSKDDQYVKDLKKQAEDVDLMIDRMEEQVKNLTKAYRDEVTQIEKSFETERGELLDNSQRKWDQALTGRGDQELEYMRQRERRVEEFEKQLQHLRIQDADEYNMVKIKLETDVQVLEQQLQQMKATYQLNQEKLEYNFQVLKKRDEENTITKSQQKRKITRLQDVMNNLKVKLSKQEKQYREENQGLADDYKRITEQFKELQKKSKHFQATDTRKFHDIWCMNEEQVKELAHTCLGQDRIIAEQQLGLTWKSPQDMWFMDSVGPIRSRKSQAEATATSAHDVIKEAMSAGSGDRPDEETMEESQPDGGPEEGADGAAAAVAGETEAEKTKVSIKTIKRVLELLCDESGFLVESKLNTLLAPLEKDERCLMKLDAIFGALGVETEDDVHKLTAVFIKYQTPPEAPATEGRTVDEAAPFAVDTDKQILEGGETSTQSLSKHRASQVTQPTTTRVGQASEDAEGVEQDDFDEGDNAEILHVTGRQEEAAGSVRSTRSDAPELIHPNDVGKALRDFVNEHSKPAKEKAKYQTFRIIAGEERDDSEDAAYWGSFPSVLSKKQEKVWKALLDGLEKYSDVLNQRGKLITETDSLRQQNAELRMLLHQYVNSKVNQELEIPPTRVLNLDVPQ